MSYVPHTERERRDMLAAIGVDRMEDLFADVPAQVRFPELKLPAALAEPDLLREMQAQAARNFPVDPARSFLGAGVYHHFARRPSTMSSLVASSTPPTRSTSPRSARGCSRRCSSTKA